MISSFCCVSAMAFQVTVNHLYSTVLCKLKPNKMSIAEIVFYDLFAMFTFSLLILFFYRSEEINRFDFFSNRLRLKEAKQSNKILQKLPSPLVVFEEETPVFWNNAVADLDSRIQHFKETPLDAADLKKEQKVNETLIIHQCRVSRNS